MNRQPDRVSEPFFARSVYEAEVGDVWTEVYGDQCFLVSKIEDGRTAYLPMNSYFDAQAMSAPRSISASPVPLREESCHSHVHRDSNGFLHRCYHKCRSLLTWQFFLGLTLSFPIEHALWTKVTPFVQIAEWLGLGINHHH